MKHHCHCGLHDQLKRFSAKKLGLLGITLMIGHLLFHVVECLILPALIVGFSGHHDHQTASAESLETVTAVIEESLLETTPGGLRVNLKPYGLLGLSEDFLIPRPPLPKPSQATL